ncbi:uncharacterized protein HKW66_Vig0011720 [Vigna angularis]|uniref:Uncharacterized protein n=1 Tax=Phaseolus angularis TaxID=3914 RepID=A0A8T0LES4_PHAAN|nr:uncharacterized protein HKW66_Vig0011720 [Vigna angularis]
MTVEGPPPPEESRSKVVSAAALAGPDIGRAAGRGIPPAPVVQAQPAQCAAVSWRSAGYVSTGADARAIRSSPMARGPPPPMPPGQFVPPRPGGGPPQFSVPPPQFGQRPMGPPPPRQMILVRPSASVFVLEFAFEKFTVKTDLCLVEFTVIILVRLSASVFVLEFAFEKCSN